MSGLWIACRMGWRNLGRNPRRSLITASAVGAAFASLMALIGLMEGLKDQLLENGTSLQLGHLQIHDGAYLPHRSLHDTIRAKSREGLERLLAGLESRPAVRAASPRAWGYALLSTGEHSAGAQVLGVVPQLEARVTTLLDSRIDGQQLSGIPSRLVILGRGLARELRAAPGDEVAVVTQAADGSLGNELFRVAAVLGTGLSHVDRTLAVTHLEDLQALLVLEPGRVHEIAVRVDDPLAARSVSEELNGAGLLPPGAVAKSWEDLSPQLRDYMNITEGMNGFIISLVALFAAFGLLNTMMMSVFERTREIGMLGSLGMRPVLILVSFLSEALVLTVLGLAGGLVVGSAVLAHLVSSGWDLSRWIGDMSMMNTRMDPVLRGSWAWDQIVWAAVGLAIAALVAALLSARRVAWMAPVEALTAPTEG